MNSQILVLIISFLMIVIIALTITYLKMSIDEKNDSDKKKKENTKKNENLNRKKTAYKEYDVKSIFDFMEFEKIEDNMIIQKNGKKFLMIIECQGINYDLMSEIEKTGVESGFLQFLNSLREPIQIYTQTRTINLENSIQNYKDRLNNVKDRLTALENKLKIALQSGQEDERTINKIKLEIAKEKNLYEYGKDVIFNTERMSSNKNVLRKKYYIIVPYYYQENEDEFFDKTEVRNIAFSELYTKSQSIIRVLGATGVAGKVLDSYELVDVLYNAYNRDEAENYGIEKALKAGFDELYITAPSVLDKKMAALDSEIEKRAIEKAREAIEEAKSQKEKNIEEKEKSLDELADEMAAMILQENERYIGKEITTKAKKIVKTKGRKGDA